MTVMHRGVVDGELHPGFVDECVECMPQDDGEVDLAVVLQLGAPGPWWHRLWCRFVAWYLNGQVEQAMRRHPAGKQKKEES